MKLNIEIDDSLKAFLEEQALEGGYGSQAQYIQSLIEDDREGLPSRLRNKSCSLKSRTPTVT